MSGIKDNKKLLNAMRMKQVVHWKGRKVEAGLRSRRFKRDYYNVTYGILCVSLGLGIFTFIAYSTSMGLSLRVKFILSAVSISIASISIILYLIRSVMDYWSIYISSLSKISIKDIANEQDIEVIKKGKKHNPIKVLFNTKKDNLKLLRVALSLMKYAISLFLVLFAETLVFMRSPKVTWVILMFLVFESIIFSIDVIKYVIDCFEFYMGWKNIKKTEELCRSKRNNVGLNKCDTNKRFVLIARIKKDVLFIIKVTSFSVSLAVTIMVLKEVGSVAVHKPRIKCVKFAILISIFLIITFVHFFVLEILSDDIIKFVSTEKDFWKKMEKCLEKECELLEKGESLSVLEDDVEYNKNKRELSYLIDKEGLGYLLYDLGIPTEIHVNGVWNTVCKEQVGNENDGQKGLI